MKPLKNNDFADVVFGRKSVRVYDETVKISHEEMLEMIGEATSAPSAVNMQPWRFQVIETKEGKEKLRPLIRFNTRQNETSAAMVLVFGDLKSYEYGEAIYRKAYEEGKMPKEVMEKQLAAIIPMYQNTPKEIMENTVKVDASLAAMQFMLVARAHGYDTNPIGGFEAAHLAEAVGLDPERYVPVMILSIGQAAEEGYASVRLTPEEITDFQ